MALITLDYFNALPLGITKAMLAKIGDDALTQMIDVASQQVCNYCNRIFERQEITDQFWGNDRMRALVGEYPVLTLSSVTWEDDAGLTGEDEVAFMRNLRGGVVERKDTSLARSVGYPLDSPFGANTWRSDRFYTVTYEAGFDPIPGPVKHATALWVAELIQPMFAGPNKEAAQVIPLSSEQITELLEEYRRRRSV